jgi:XTP/dITP diphosphohydrolase
MSNNKSLYVATNNKDKFNEIKAILRGVVEVYSVYDAVDSHIIVYEDGMTFEENASIKASAFSKIVDLPVIADDSGLCVDILNGRPGVYSARYAGQSGLQTFENLSFQQASQPSGGGFSGSQFVNDENNINKLLNELEGIDLERRKAHFICVIALAYKGKAIKCFKGVVDGFIGFARAGSNGFGYDPVFYIDMNKSFAMLSKDEKNRISHRYKALMALRTYLEENDVL